MRTLTRWMALPVMGALLFASGAPASADTGALRTNASSAISWVADQTNDDGTLSSYGTDPDLGLTLDAALAGMAAGAPRATIDGWITSGAGHFPTIASDNGKVAKALVTLAAAGKSTTSYGGYNPEQMVRSSVGTDGHAAGTNAFGQSFAMIGMARTGALPASTVTFLAGQQCASGAFPLNFGPDAAAKCDQDATMAHPDGTAMAVMALRAAEAEGHRGAASLRAKAVSWLKAKQRANGSYAGEVRYNPSENTNTAGLVAAALSDLEPAVVARIGTWVAGQQLTSGSDAGAVAYRRDDLANPISRVTKGAWVRATSQAVFAFAPVDFYRLTPRFHRTAPYTLEGTHTINGRQWKTSCEPYSQTERCRTDIWATVVRVDNGRFVRENGWAFNNLTYLPFMTEASWQGNPLAMHNMFGFTSGGRQWRTECHTAQTGRGACRSYTMTTVYAAAPRPAGGYAFSQKNEWVFNNIVMFGGPELR